MSSAAILQDSFSRQFHYLRLSVTDRCNFRCAYCLPNGYQKTEFSESELSVAEIAYLARAFAKMGFWKIRLTGGEPTVRQDILEISRAVASVPGIRRVAISTNGAKLRELARPLRDAGVSAVNISVDSVEGAAFSEITGTARFDAVWDGVEAALSAGFDTVKLNAVLLRDWNLDQLDRFLGVIRDRRVSVRFIELMRTSENASFFERRHVSGGELKLRLLARGFVPLDRKRGDGPAVEFSHPDYTGRVGIIAPYSSEFCQSCNRLRVSARGELRLCLFGEGSVSLRHLLREPGREDEIAEVVRSALSRKEVSHYLKEGRYGDTANLSQFGG